MNTKTRKELSKLADLLSLDSNIDEALETSTLSHLAIYLADKNQIDLSAPTIRNYEEWLKCKIFDILDECEGAEYDFDTEVLDSQKTSFNEAKSEDDIILEAAAIILRRRSQKDSSDDWFTKPKVYTIFNEDADGRITVTRGAYSKDEYEGKTPKEINEMRGWPCMAGWADRILRENESLGEHRQGALTEDDIEVLQKIKRNEI